MRQQTVDGMVLDKLHDAVYRYCTADLMSDLAYTTTSTVWIKIK